MMNWTSPGFCLKGLNNATPISSPILFIWLDFIFQEARTPRAKISRREKPILRKKTVCFTVF